MVLVMMGIVLMLRCNGSDSGDGSYGDCGDDKR